MSIHMRDIGEAVFGLFHWHAAEVEPGLTDDQRLLIAAYRSGQVPEAAWQEHLEHDPVLAQYWRTNPRQ